MLSKNKSVSLCKGQNQGEFSPSSNVLKDIMSPCGVQNGVSPDYVSKASVNKSFNRLFYRKCGRGGLVFDESCLWTGKESQGFS